jgi:Stress responsive A/B Barrel Domain
MMLHTVIFWLKPDLNADQTAEFEVGLRILAATEAVRFQHIGTPAATHRAVVDRSYGYKLVLGFDDLAGHDRYQVDPDHLDFVARCAKYWHTVRIYDSDESALKTH